MKLFRCQACGQPLHFENTSCERCGRRVGYLPALGVLAAVEPDGDGWRTFAADATRYRFCANWELSACNWMVAAGSGDRFCRACRHNRTIPDIADPVRHRLWQKVEEAKRRLFYSLIRLDLPTPTVADGDPEPLVFDFLADPPVGPHVMTGHDNGLITISLSEADDAERERLRTAMGEPYRTLLGHFRHEVGHFYWDRLVRDAPLALDLFRAAFGDERADYAAALQRHYGAGPPAEWTQSFVSAYAASHPWEDWAETFAHYLHIVDTLEMGRAVGLRVSLDAPDTTRVDVDPYEENDLAALIAAWIPLSIAVNSLNRAMGQPDLYPFVLSPPVIAKLGFVHAVVHRLG